VRDPAVHVRVLQDITQFAQAQGFMVAGLTRSQLKGPAGNIEFLAWLSWGGTREPIDISSQIQKVLPHTT